MAQVYARSLCAATRRVEHLALCQLVLTADGKLPEWVELIPPGPEVNAVDGRRFRNSAPSRIITAFQTYGLHLPVDLEHSTEIKAPKGEEAPAAGWIVELQVREGAVWGRVEWTPRGMAALTSRDYRYISPAFMHAKNGEITELVSAGLTNKPALTQLAAVAHAAENNHDGGPEPARQEDIMDKELLKLLGLDEKATPEQVLAACRALKDAAAKQETDLATARAELAKAQAPDLTKFVPRADHDAAIARAQKAEQDLAADRQALKQREIDGEVDAALKAGKITPATAEYHKAACSREGGLAAFRDFVKAAPVIVAPSNLDGKPAPTGDALSAVELSVCTQMGLTKEAFIAAKKAQKA